MIDSLNFNQYR